MWRRESHAINDMPEFKAWMANKIQEMVLAAITLDEITAEYEEMRYLNMRAELFQLIRMAS